MTDPTLAGGTSKQFVSSGTKTFTLYGVQTEIIRKTGNFIDLPKPLNDSNAKLMMDLLGASREITIDRVVTSGDATAGSFELYEYAQDLVGLGVTDGGSPANLYWNALIFGTQGSNGGQAGYTYTSEILNRGTSGVTMRVYVSNANVISDKGNPNSFKYSVTLLECSGTGSL